MFVVSKVAGLLLQPINLVLVVLVLAAALSWTRFRRLGRVLATALAVGLGMVAVAPWDAWLLAPIEERFPQPALPARVDGVVVLGGAFDPVVSAARGQPAANGAIERVTALVALARRYPEAVMVFTGGSGSVAHPDLREAPVARAFLEAIGFESGRVLFEGDSRNTRENAVLTREMVRPQPGQTWVLVTSALHMPRAVGSFRSAGWEVIPYPVDYTTAGGEPRLRFDVGAGLGMLGTALHEIYGLAYYRLQGWSDALYPAPAGQM
ncbi:YdcF family protein [Magnetospirillum sp. UT-4]|uniref:YdcF family protein n=1 Tax=Magnetospirillum sp. UT-4 TaxID=2681467 RepID=UPI0013804B09|nr:YdcF family protein [Magnetospirillum sp. UT-4]CAA7617949.1 conserved hypothetical protein [Magnetospirillum sp. UT-4]